MLGESEALKKGILEKNIVAEQEPQGRPFPVDGVSQVHTQRMVIFREATCVNATEFKSVVGTTPKSLQLASFEGWDDDGEPEDLFLVNDDVGVANKCLRKVRLEISRGMVRKTHRVLPVAHTVEEAAQLHDQHLCQQSGTTKKLS
eukprot:6566028-Pyramimonas_sp.AAC.1